MATHRSATLRDVAEEAGLSVSTISRALAGNPVIPEETQERARKAAAKLNYRPNAQARALRSARTNTIGLIVPNMLNQFFAELATSIQNSAVDASLCTLIASTNEDPDQLKRALEVMEDQRVDGLIVVPHAGGEEYINNLRAKGVPIILFDRHLEGCDAPAVISNPEPGLRAAITQLKENGHTRIGYLAGPDNTSTGVERRQTVEDLCNEFGGLDLVIAEGGYLLEEGFEGAENLLDAKVTAIIAGDSMMTLGALQAAHGRQLEIGEDISIVGFDNFLSFQVQKHPLTVIDQNVAQLGKTSFEILQHGINLAQERRRKAGRGQPIPNDNTPAITSLPTSLVVRDSIGPAKK
ncbi:MAG: LacI family DNA-binding transcriptional regulator [Corynebacterium sp.]|nr:LacI family DNA-binding transcriptional regulator [Corynebacterium sp.]